MRTGCPRFRRDGLDVCIGRAKHVAPWRLNEIYLVGQQGIRALLMAEDGTPCAKIESGFAGRAPKLARAPNVPVGLDASGLDRLFPRVPV
jgi:hypothetical protein